MISKVPLTGGWKVCPEFLDMGIERFQEVLNRGEGKPYLVSWPPHFLTRQGYFDMSIPGDVITPLIDNGIIGEVMNGTNSSEIDWIKDRSWWFIRQFEVSAQILEEEQVRLVAEQLDYKADIMINNIYIGKHCNAFRPFLEDVRYALHEGINQIIIRLTSGTEDFYPVDSYSVYTDTSIKCRQRLHIRKPQFSYGWDWCPMIPTCGIGRDIYLEAFSGAKIQHMRCETLSLEEGRAELELTFEAEKLLMQSTEEILLEYEVLYDGKTVKCGKIPVVAAGGINRLTDRISIDNPKLWWPNGYGNPELYTVRAVCRCRGISNEMKPYQIGIRKVEVDTSSLADGTHNFFVRINGVRIFCKGANWVPADSVYMRITSEKYSILIEEAVEANFNMLRIWGGGMYETDDFYELCARKGILLFHDFMFACGFYPDTRPEFMYEVYQEVMYQTKRLAHCPSLVIWSGNNENHESFTDWFSEGAAPRRLYGERIFNYMIPEIVRANTSVFYMPSSPYFGKTANEMTQGDVHAWTFFGRDEKTRFRFCYELEAFDRFHPRFCSEYGFYGPLMESSVQRYFAGEEISFSSPIWKHHGEADYKRESIDGAIRNHLTDSARLTESEYLFYGGLMQGILYQEMAEAIRRQNQSSGFLIWMYNDAWPETGWTIIDYYLTRKISFYFLKRAFSHRKIIVRGQEKQTDVILINDTPEVINMQLECGYMDFFGECSDIKRLEVTAKAHSWQQFILEIKEGEKEGFFYARSDHPDFETACSLRAYYRKMNIPEAKVSVETKTDGEDILATVCSDKFVPFACISCGEETTRFSDNYMQLFPNEEKTIRICRAKGSEVKVKTLSFSKQ